MRRHADIAIWRTEFGKHMGIEKIEELLSVLGRRAAGHPFFRFGIMREPASYLVSLYNFHQLDGFDGEITSTKGMTFDAFLDVWAANSWQTKGQRFLFLDKGGAYKLDFLARYESLDDDLRFVANRIEIDFKIQVKNASPKHLSILDLTKRQLDAIKDRFRDDYLFYEEHAGRR